MTSRFAALIGLTLVVLTVLAGLAAGDFAQSRIRQLADQTLSFEGGRVDAGVGVFRLGGFSHGR